MACLVRLGASTFSVRSVGLPYTRFDHLAVTRPSPLAKCYGSLRPGSLVFQMLMKSEARRTIAVCPAGQTGEELYKWGEAR
jgi:hypothetical protein